MKKNRSLHRVRFWELMVDFMCVALVLVFGSVGSFRLLALVQVLVLCRCFCGVRRCLFSAWLSNNGINLTP